MLEQAAGVGTISLQNIYQAATIDPQGTIRRSSAQDMLSSLQEAAQATANKKTWLTYQIKQRVNTEFEGYELPDTLATEATRRATQVTNGPAQ
jgi:hypothetical protein